MAGIIIGYDRSINGKFASEVCFKVFCELLIALKISQKVHQFGYCSFKGHIIAVHYPYFTEFSAGFITAKFYRSNLALGNILNFMS